MWLHILDADIVRQESLFIFRKWKQKPGFIANYSKKYRFDWSAHA